jgi:hypothetical protein
MNRHKSRIQKNPIPKEKRRYHGESSVEGLVNWLNTTQDSKGRDRIIEVLSTFFQVMTLVQDVQQTTTKDAEGFYHWKPQIRALIKKLNDLMSYYTVAPGVLFVPPSSDRGYVGLNAAWRAAPGSELARHLSTLPRSDVGQKSKKPVGLPLSERNENGAMLEIHGLIRSGLIFKVLRCRCGNFFFQKFKTQRFCSEKCRIAEFRDSDEARLKRNAYARELYHSKKALEEGKRR